MSKRVLERYQAENEKKRLFRSELAKQSQKELPVIQLSFEVEDLPPSKLKSKEKTPAKIKSVTLAQTTSENT
jgi:hypothetical protein